MTGQPEHISGISVVINGVALPTGAPANTPDGHKVPAGMTLTLNLADGLNHVIGTTAGSPSEDRYGFGYSEGLTLANGVSAQTSSVTGPASATYYKNAMNVCMKQMVAVTKTTTALLIDQLRFSTTTSMTQNVGGESVALPENCK